MTGGLEDGKDTKTVALRWSVTAAILATIVVNAYANIGRLAGRTTGEVAELYPTLFTPAGITFSIWSLIYLGLIGYAIYQFPALRERAKSKLSQNYFDRSSWLVVASCLLNICWIFAWHNQAIFLSGIVIILLWVVLAGIVWQHRRVFLGQGLSGLDYLAAKLPFLIYLGWITVAVFANKMAWLVSEGWDFFQRSQEAIVLIGLIIAGVLGMVLALVLAEWPVAAVLLWAYAGILGKHLAAAGWGGAYPAIIVTVTVFLFLLTVLVGYLVWRQLRGRTEK